MTLFLQFTDFKENILYIYFLERKFFEIFDDFLANNFELFWGINFPVKPLPIIAK
jgi:hypothetical protein